MRKVMLVLLSATLFVSCGGETKEPSKRINKEPANTQEVVAKDKDFWTIQEEPFNVSNPEMEAAKGGSSIDTEKPAKANESDGDGDTAIMEEVPMEVTIESIQPILVDYNIVEVDPVTITESYIPLEETQEVTAYSKKGKAKADLEVYTDAQTGMVEQVVFTNKKHTDVFNVSVGMSVKELKQLRKDLKYLKRHGKVFYYTDDSQIMYSVDVSDIDSEEIESEIIDERNVEAIIWKGKK